MRLIDVDELAKRWTIASPEPYNTDAVEVLDSIREAPTVDAVPVVWCKGCKYFTRTTKHGFTACLNTRGGMLSPDPDGFCYRGERRKTK